MFGYLSSLFGDRPAPIIANPIIAKLEKELKKVKETYSNGKERKKEARTVIKAALKDLQKEEPSAFQEARRSGAGTLVEILNVTEAILENKMTGKQFMSGCGGPPRELTTEEGYLQAQFTRTRDGKQLTYNKLNSVAEFIGVSLLPW